MGVRNFVSIATKFYQRGSSAVRGPDTTRVSHLQRIWFFRAWGGQDFTVSERVEIGKAVEAKLNETERRGRPKQDNEDQGELVEDEIPANWPEFESGETREIAAKKAGFDSEQTYRRAKTVVENAEPELVAAMDQGTIAPSMP